MFNNSNSCGPNEAATNMMPSVTSSQSNDSSVHNNLNDISKIMHQTASSPSEYYDPYNFQHINRPVVNMPPLMYPLQAYQNIGHGSPFPSPNTQFSHENASQNFLPPVHADNPSENHNKMFSLSENYQTKTLSDLLSSTFREPNIAKGYPINIPQVPSNMSSNAKEMNKLKDKSESTSILAKENDQDKTTGETSGHNTPKNTNSASRYPTKAALKANVNPDDTENLKDLDAHPETSQSAKHKTIEPSDMGSSGNQNIPSGMLENYLKQPPKAQKSTYKIINNNTSEDNILKPIILKKTLSENKRKSLEKTVKIIESFLCKSSNSIKPNIKNSSNKPVIEENTDPLALSPCPKEGNSKEANSDSDSDDEVLVKTAYSNSIPASSSHKDITSFNTEESRKEIPIDGEVRVKVEDIKIEPLNWEGAEGENPFLRDSNGINRDVVGDRKIIGMESSVEEAVATAKSGAASLAYFECPDCQLLFLHPKRFLIHTKWHSFGLLNEKRAQLAMEREIRVRMRRDARREERIQRLSAALPETVAKALRCKDCDLVLPTRSSYRTHRTRAHPKEARQCKVCLMPVKDLKALREHLVTHENKESGEYQCPHCNKIFKYRHALTKHADIHREKRHSCPTCGKMFGSQSLVKRHLITHDRQARSPDLCCTYCGKAFYEAYHLRVHERTHINDRPFKCETCQSSFVSNSGLRRHIRVSHEANGSKPFSCPVCQKCFSSENIRDRHELRAHTDQTLLPHHCDTCGARFVKLKDLKTHVYRLHPTGTPKKRKNRSGRNSDEIDE